MPKSTKSVTPDNRVERWSKLWGKAKRLDDAATETAFEEFQDAFVPSRMHKLFLKTFGNPKGQFDNRFFGDDSVFQNWDTKLSSVMLADGHAEVTVIYGSPDELEGHWMRGEVRRSLRDIVIDDWHAACAIVRVEGKTLYVFVGPKMRGCIVRTVQDDCKS